METFTYTITGAAYRNWELKESPVSSPFLKRDHKKTSSLWACLLLANLHVGELTVQTNARFDHLVNWKNAEWGVTGLNPFKTNNDI